MARFKQIKGTSRFIDTTKKEGEAGREISRRARDKILKVGEYRPLGSEIKKRAPKRFSKQKNGRFIDNKTGQEISSYQKRIIASGLSKTDFLEKQSLYRKSKKIPNALSKAQLKNLRNRLELSYENAGFLTRFDENGNEIKRLEMSESVENVIKFLQLSKQNVNKDNEKFKTTERLSIKDINKIFGKNFKNYEEYYIFIEDCFDAIGYNRPDFNRYV